MVDEAQQEIYQIQNQVTSQRHKVNWKIEGGKTIAAFVAYKKEYVMIDDILGDERFPLGIGHQGITSCLIDIISILHAHVYRSIGKISDVCTSVYT